MGAPALVLLAAYLLAGRTAATTATGAGGCFGYPEGCSCATTTDQSNNTDRCRIQVNWQEVNADLFSVELSGQTEDYLGVGWPDTEGMSPAPVVMCSDSLANKAQIYWNSINMNSSPAANSTPGLLSAVSLGTVNNTLVCKFKIKSKFHVVSCDGPSASIDLQANSYYLIISAGPMSNGALGYHKEKRRRSREKIRWGVSYSGGYSGCFGLPANCDCNTNCSLKVEWEGASSKSYSVHLTGPGQTDSYLAVGWPATPAMGPAPVVVCSDSLPGKQAVYFNTDQHSSKPAQSSTPGMVTVKNFSMEAGQLSCSLEVTSEFIVTSAENTSIGINLDTSKIYLVLAMGSFSSENMGYHSKRIKSDTAFVWGDNNPYLTTSSTTAAVTTTTLISTTSSSSPSKIYNNCQKTKGCFGYPSGCVEKKNCDIISTYSKLSTEEYKFEIGMKSSSTGYAAVGLSYDNMMGNDSVMACVKSKDSSDVTMYWNYPGHIPSVKLNDSHLGLSNFSYSDDDGFYICSFQRKSITTIYIESNKSNYTFDLNNQDFFLLMAVGPLSDDNISPHTSRVASDSLINLNFDPNPTAGCFGLPENCLCNTNCSVEVEWVGISKDTYSVRLAGGTKDSYLAVGWPSRPNMGPAPVVACSEKLAKKCVVNFNSPAYSSQSANTSTDSMVVVKNVSVVDDKLECWFELLSEFQVTSQDNTTAIIDLNIQPIHVILATGTVSAGIIQQHSHDNRAVSENTFVWGHNNNFYSNSSTTPSTTVKTTTPSPVNYDIYKGCYESKGCFGYPGDCVEKKTCDFVATYSKVSDEEFKFEIGGKTDNDKAYSALGLSFDNKMGSDSVMACIRSNDKVEVSMYWNTNNYGSIPLADPHFGLSQTEGSIVDGFAKCTFYRQSVTEVPVPGGNTTKFDLTAEKFYLLIAQGPLDGGEKIAQHSQRTVSTDKMDLSLFDPVKGESQLVQIVHGMAMLTAWILLSNIGVFVARYTKNIFKDMKILGKDAWFPIHQFCMLAVILFSIIGIIPMVYQRGFDPMTRMVNHALVGTATLAVAFLQPLLAMMRCAPDSPRRPIFNWTHRLLGFSSLVLGWVTVFLSTKLTNQVMPSYTQYILYIVAIAIVTTHCGMSISFNGERAAYQSTSREDWRIKTMATIAFISVVALAYILLCVMVILGSTNES